MKKITIFIACIVISSFLFGEDILPEESFETSVPPAGWYDYSDPSWETWMQNGSQHHTGSYSAAHGPTMEYTTSWLITPAIDLTGYTDITLTYWEYVIIYGGADIQSVKISTDYTGSGDPSLATWQTLNSTIGAEDTWSRVELDLSSYSDSTVYIGFQYGGADATMWFIDDVKISVEGASVMPESNGDNFFCLSNYPNPCIYSTTICYSLNDKLFSGPVEISIYNVEGQLVERVNGNESQIILNTKNYTSGVYFYKINIDNLNTINKLMVIK